MHLFNVTRTAVLTASTILTRSPDSVTSLPAQHPSSSPHSNKPWFPPPRPWYGKPNSTWDPTVDAPSTPEFFLHDEKPAEDYIDEPALRTCTRKAVQLAGREHYEKIASKKKSPYSKFRTAWQEWVRVNQQGHLKDADDNRDGNTVDGLADYVIRSALEKNASLDRNIADNATCIRLVDHFARTPLLDEILRAWGWREGIFTKPSWMSYKPGHNKGPPIERRHAAAYVASTYGNGTGQILYPGNSTHPTLVIKYDENSFPVSFTIPEKEIGVHFTWGILNNFTIDNSTVSGWPVLITQIPMPGDVPIPIPRPLPPPPPGFETGKPSAEGSTLLGRSTRPFNSTRQPGWGWVPVPAGNLTSGPGSSLNYTDRFPNSAGIGLPSWRWVPIPITSNSSVVEGVPGFLDGVARLYSCPVNSTGPTKVPRVLNGVARLFSCPGNSTSPFHAPGKLTRRHKSVSAESISVTWPPTSVPTDAHIPGRELLTAFDKFEDILAILVPRRNLTNHGNWNGHLSPRSKVHSEPSKGGATVEEIIGKIFEIIGKVKDKHDG